MTVKFFSSHTDVSFLEHWAYGPEGQSVQFLGCCSEEALEKALRFCEEKEERQ